MANTPKDQITISLDVDGTLADIYKPFLRTAEKRFNLPELEETVKKSGLSEVFCKIPHARELIKGVWQNFKELKPIEPDLPEIINEITNGHGYRVVISTATYGRSSDVIKWLNHNGITFESFFHFDEPSDKLKTHSNAHIDDSISLSKLLDSDKVGIFMGGWWNKPEYLGAVPSKNVFIAKDWKEIRDLLCDGNQIFKSIKRASHIENAVPHATVARIKT